VFFFARRRKRQPGRPVISAALHRDRLGRVYAFSVRNHGHSAVCGAVSMLAINTANSVQALTREPFACYCNEADAFIWLELPHVKHGGESRGAALLLEAMALGLWSVKARYSDEIEIKEDDND